MYFIFIKTSSIQFQQEKILAFDVCYVNLCENVFEMFDIIYTCIIEQNILQSIVSSSKIAKFLNVYIHF